VAKRNPQEVSGERGRDPRKSKHTCADDVLQRADIDEDPLAHLLDEAEQAIVDDPEHATRCLAEAQALCPNDPDVTYLRACLALNEHRIVDARVLFERTLSLQEDHTEAHYALGLLCCDAGDERGAIAHWLRVRELDARHDVDAGVGTRADLDFIEAEAERVLANLPEQFRDRVEHVAIVLEPRPSQALVEHGFDPRALGLFEGSEDRASAHGDVQVLPTRIVLYYTNLLVEFSDDDELAEQIEITILHEIGHFFGLDEQAMERLGLA